MAEDHEIAGSNPAYPIVIIMKKFDYKALDAVLAKDKRVKKMIQLVGKHKFVLDLGCFSGYMIQKFIENENKAWGTDTNKDFLIHCRKKGLEVFNADCERQLPFDTSSFDVVVAGELIEHIYDTDKFLEECNRVLRPGGELIISTPNMGFWKHRLKLLLGLNMPFEYGGDAGFFIGHIRYFNLASFKRAISGHGFSLERVETSYYFSGNDGNSFLNIFIPNIFKNHGFHIIAVLKKE